MQIHFLHEFVFYILTALFLSSCSKDVLLVDDFSLVNGEITDSVLTINDKAKQWLYRLCSRDFQGRKTGTIGDGMARSYIIDELEAMGYEPYLQEFCTENGTLLANIIVNIKGESDSTIILGAHYDGAKMSTKTVHYPAAEDNASGVVALLSFLKFYKDIHVNTQLSIVCCFWDSEEVFEGRAFRGSRHFIDQLDTKSYILLYQNLDAIGHDHNGMVRMRYWDWKNDGRLVDALNRITANGRFQYIIEPTPSGGASDYATFNAVKIPFIAYHDHDATKPCSHPNHSEEDKPEFISIDKLLKIVDNTREMISTY